MSQSASPRRAWPLLLLAVLLLAGLPAQGQPVAGAHVSVTGAARALGVFDVAPVPGVAGSGLATGTIVSSVVAETAAEGNATGSAVLSSLRVASADAHAKGGIEVFRAIDIPGFTPTSRLEGVGTSSLTLRGSTAVLSLTDAANSLLTIRATGTSVRSVVLHLPSGVSVLPHETHANVWEVTSAGAAHLRGFLVLQTTRGGADGAGLIATDVEGEVRALLNPGAQLVFRADPGHAQGAGARAYHEAVVSALASASLAGETTTQVATGQKLLVDASHFTNALARSQARAENRITTQVRAAVAGGTSGHTVAYDLDYVDVPAQAASQVAVYVDGALAPRVETASDVLENAQAGRVSYWAATASGRVLVLASTAAQARASTLTVASLPHGADAAETLAQLDARLGVVGGVEGSYSLLGDFPTQAEGSGALLGSFNSFGVSEARGRAHVEDYTDIRSSTAIFERIDLAAQATADATAQVEPLGGAGAQAARSVRMHTSVLGQVVAAATFTDSALSTIVADARAATTARFELAHEATATLISDHVARIDGPGGVLGYLVLARADGSAAADSKLDASDLGEVQARLAPGERVVFRAAAEAHARASALVLARSLAAGELASEVSLAPAVNTLGYSSVDYTTTLATRVAAEATKRGIVTLDVESRAKGAAALAITADRGALVAESPADILVRVEGASTERVDTAGEVLARLRAGSTSATYAVTTSLEGRTQVLLALPPLDADTAARVVIESQLEARRRLNAALDVSGAFRAAYGGVATGSIVSLVAKEDAGLLLDYTVAARASKEADAQTTRVFDAVRVGASAFASASAATASSLRFRSEDAIVDVYDVSSGLLRVAAAGTTSVRFDLAENLAARAVSEAVVLLEAPDFQGALILVRGTADGEAHSRLQANLAPQGIITAALAPGTQVLFKAFSGFEAELSAEEKLAQATAIASGTLLGQVIVDSSATAAAEAVGLSALTIEAPPSSMATTVVNYYGEVQAFVSVASEDKVEVLVESATNVGRSIVISLDRNTVSGLIRGDARLLVDGESVPRADSYADALTPDADKYWLITTDGEAGLQAIVALSHFSTRTITIEKPDGPSVFLWTTLGLAGIVLFQAAYPRFRRRRG